MRSINTYFEVYVYKKGNLYSRNLFKQYFLNTY